MLCGSGMNGAGEPAAGLTPAAEWLNAAIDRMLAERRPTDAPVGSDEAELLAVAAVLKLLRPGAATPRLAYADALDRRLRSADSRPPLVVSRRAALAASTVLVAAVVAGLLRRRLVRDGAEP